MDVAGFIIYMTILGTIGGLTIYYMIKFVRIVNGNKEDSRHLRKGILHHLLVMLGEALAALIYHWLK
jgi:hypothetical protein